MKLKLEFCRYLCSAAEFKINGIDADVDDFGEKNDEAPELAEPYGCGNMQFKGKPSTEEVLKKYEITEKEYQEIVSKLEGGLSFGQCGWCV